MSENDAAVLGLLILVVGCCGLCSAQSPAACKETCEPNAVAFANPWKCECATGANTDSDTVAKGGDRE